MNRYLSEFIGTFFLVLTIGLAASYGDRFAPIAVGSVLIVLTYLGIKTSGAHYNPAVTLAVFIRKKIKLKDAGFYLLAQLLGGFAAAGLVMLTVLDDSFIFELRPGRGEFPIQALLIETIFTFFIVLVYLITTQSRLLRGNDFYGIAIGLALMVAMFVGGPISGGAFNLVTGISANVLAMEFSHIWIYAVGPLLGGTMAGYASRVYLAS